MKGDWQMIGRKLPLLTAGLTTVAVAVVAAAAYRQMRNALVRSADERLRNASTQVAATMGSSYASLARNGTPLSRDSIIRRALAAPSAESRAAAQRRLVAERSGDSLAIALELTDTTGHRIATVGDSAFLDAAGGGAPSRSVVLHPLIARAGTVLTDMQVPVMGDGQRVIGAIRKVARVSSAQSRQLLSGLIGDEAKLLIGNTGDSVWTDLKSLVPRPPFQTSAATPSAGADRQAIGRGALISGTPWAVWIELPESVVLEPARAFLFQILLVALSVIALAVFGAARLSRHIIAPVRELTEAAERLAGGEYSIRAHVRHRDELGRLAKAFNAMAVAIEISTHELEQQGVELEMQQRELEESNDELRDSLEATTKAHHAAEQAQEHRAKLEEQLHQAQKMEAVGRLAGGIAHDFNNVLTVIISYSDLILASDTADDATRADVQQVREAAARAAGLTKQLLAFSRKQVLRPVAMDVNDVVRDALGMLTRVIPTNITVRTNLDDSIGAIHADRGQIEQVLLNLAANARDAMPDGGVLSIETSSAVLDDAYLTMHPTGRVGPHVILTVRDTGLGMDAATQARIFEPFFTTKENGKGTGLGLATVYGIVQQSGGSVYVYSEPGRGTTFKLYFPRTDEAPERRSEIPMELHPVQPLRILLAEDDALVRDAIAVVLARLGHTVTCCEDASAALAYLAEGEDRVDLVVSDVVMPGKSGLDLAEILRREYPRLPIVLVSGYSEEAVVGGRPIPEDTPFVEKPFTAHDIGKAIATALQLRRSPHESTTAA